MYKCTRLWDSGRDLIACVRSGCTVEMLCHVNDWLQSRLSSSFDSSISSWTPRYATGARNLLLVDHEDGVERAGCDREWCVHRKDQTSLVGRRARARHHRERVEPGWKARPTLSRPLLDARVASDLITSL